jgi:hypothetical protein
MPKRLRDQDYDRVRQLADLLEKQGFTFFAKNYKRIIFDDYPNFLVLCSHDFDFTDLSAFPPKDHFNLLIIGQREDKLAYYIFEDSALIYELHQTEAEIFDVETAEDYEDVKRFIQGIIINKDFAGPYCLSE